MGTLGDEGATEREDGWSGTQEDGRATERTDGWTGMGEDGWATEREDGRTGTQADKPATEREDCRTIALATGKLFVRRITLYARRYSLVNISPCCGCLSAIPCRILSISPLRWRFAASGLVCDLLYLTCYTEA